MRRKRRKRRDEDVQEPGRGGLWRKEGRKEDEKLTSRGIRKGKRIYCFGVRRRKKGKGEEEY